MTIQTESGTRGMISCGTDLVEIGRVRQAISRQGQPMLDRIYTAGEQADCLPDGQMTDAAAASLAARFAAKEAAAKALGTGIGRHGIAWTDISVRRRADGSPELILNGAALDWFRSAGGQDASISLSHERSLALAFCVMTWLSPERPLSDE